MSMNVAIILISKWKQASLTLIYELSLYDPHETFFEVLYSGHAIFAENLHLTWS